MILALSTLARLSNCLSIPPLGVRWGLPEAFPYSVPCFSESNRGFPRVALSWLCHPLCGIESCCQWCMDDFSIPRERLKHHWGGKGDLALPFPSNYLWSFRYSLGKSLRDDSLLLWNSKDSWGRESTVWPPNQIAEDPTYVLTYLHAPQGPIKNFSPKSLQLAWTSILHAQGHLIFILITEVTHLPPNEQLH